VTAGMASLAACSTEAGWKARKPAPQCELAPKGGAYTSEAVCARIEWLLNGEAYAARAREDWAGVRGIQR